MVLDKLVNEEIDRLPKKSLTATMPAEADLLSKMHVGAILQNEPNSTLHIDGTTKKFSEYSTFNITTGSTGKSLSLGFVEQSGGTADDYMDLTRNIFHDIAKLLLPTDAKEDEVQHKCGELIMCLKNLQTDRHIVNKSYFQQLTEFRCSMLPAVMADYDSLSAEQLGNIVRMNHTFCGLHAIHNIGSTAKETLREFETLVGFQPITSGFTKPEARSCQLLWELSKAFTQAHDYQKAGAVQYFDAYLNNLSEKNHFVSLHGERINIIFVQGGAAYYHQKHVSEYIEECSIQQNKLLSSVTDIEVKLYQACFRALGIFGKLITGPLFRLIEDDSFHIFQLNDVWNEVIKELEELSKDAQPLLNEYVVVPGGITVKDEVYNELFKETNDEEIDSVTEHCLRILSCSAAILLRCQLEDQLPGGKFYSPSAEIFMETRTTPKHNIICEHDFAHLDRKLKECPQISNIALSGMVCFINNKTPQYLESLSEEERHKLIERAVKEKAVYIKKYQQMKQKIRQRRIEIMEERRKKIAKQVENKEKRKEQLDMRLEDYGGLWRTADEMKTNLDILPLSKQKDALVTQIKYRKFVLGIKPTEKTLLQLQSGKEKFTTEQLQENLETVLQGVMQSAHVLNTKHVNIKHKEE